jgi:hypothetical protein
MLKPGKELGLQYISNSDKKEFYRRLQDHTQAVGCLDFILGTPISHRKPIFSCTTHLAQRNRGSRVIFADDNAIINSSITLTIRPDSVYNNIVVPQVVFKKLEISNPA